MRHANAPVGVTQKEGKNEETLTAIPRAARGVAPACTLAVLSLVSSSSDHMPTQTPTRTRVHVHMHTAASSAPLALAEQQEGGDQVAGASRRKDKGRGGG